MKDVKRTAIAIVILISLMLIYWDTTRWQIEDVIAASFFTFFFLVCIVIFAPGILKRIDRCLQKRSRRAYRKRIHKKEAYRKQIQKNDEWPMYEVNEDGSLGRRVC